MKIRAQVFDICKKRTS